MEILNFRPLLPVRKTVPQGTLAGSLSRPNKIALSEENLGQGGKHAVSRHDKTA